MSINGFICIDDARHVHPWPAGTENHISALYAIDLGYEDGDLSIVPALNLIAACYAACHQCQHATAATVGADHFLTTQIVGAAALHLDSMGPVEPHVLFRHLDPAGTVVALLMRNNGLSTAAETTSRFSSEVRAQIALAAAWTMTPTSWLDMNLSNFFGDFGQRPDPRWSHPADNRMLLNLKRDGYMP